LELKLELELDFEFELDWEAKLELALELLLMLLDEWLGLLSRLRPGRLMKEYWHVMPRSEHREHIGFSLGHFTLDMAQAWQLSRSFAVVPPPAPRVDVVSCEFCIVLTLTTTFNIVHCYSW
jgi:hypothetical protein